MTRMATAQTYEEMSQAVKYKMDSNKEEQIDLWTGIGFTYDVVVTGLEFQDHIELQRRASQVRDIKSLKIEDGGKVIVECVGGTPFETVKRIFSDIVTGMVSFERKDYLITIDKP